MLTYVIRRVIATIPVMAVVAFVVFSLLYVTPGDPAAIIAGEQASPADIERIRASLGLDQPFLVRFGEWVWQLRWAWSQPGRQAPSLIGSSWRLPCSDSRCRCSSSAICSPTSSRWN